MGWGRIVLLGVVVWLFSAALAASQEEVYKGSSKRDPFIPLVSPSGYLLNSEPEEDSALRLEGITYDPHGDSVAIINGDLVRVGEEINGAVVTSIEPDKVTVIRDNKKIDIELRREG